MINDGCYFLLNGDWLNSVRQWVKGKGSFAPLRRIRFSIRCSDGNWIIPGHMNHFIMGVTSVPCEVSPAGKSDRRGWKTGIVWKWWTKRRCEFYRSSSKWIRFRSVFTSARRIPASKSSFISPGSAKNAKNGRYFVE